MEEKVDQWPSKITLMSNIHIWVSKVNYSIIVKSDLYLSVSVRPNPGRSSIKSIKPFFGVGSPSKI